MALPEVNAQLNPTKNGTVRSIEDHPDTTAGIVGVPAPATFEIGVHKIVPEAPATEVTQVNCP